MSAALGTIWNPGQLKVELGISGLRLDEGARRRARLSAEESAATGIELILPEEVWVRAPLVATNEPSPFLLRGDEHAVVLQSDRGEVGVRLIEPPAFYGRPTSTGKSMGTVAAINGPFIVVNPGHNCGLGFRERPCRFCLSGDAAEPEEIFEHSVQEVSEVVRAAFAEGVAEFVFFNMEGSGEDGGISFLEPYIRAVKSNFDTAVAVQLHPPLTNGAIDQTYAMGVDAVSYGLEVFDEHAFEQHSPGRAARIGRRRYLDSLAYAASIFPSGTVWTDLIVGQEPIESTRRGIDALTAIGVLPVLSLTNDRPAPPLEELAPLYTHLFEAVRDAKINMGWIRDLSFAVTPFEARYFAGEEARMTVALQSFYRSKLGQTAARNLARLRRRLRVRRVSDSFDSSHL